MDIYKCPKVQNELLDEHRFFKKSEFAMTWREIPNEKLKIDHTNIFSFRDGHSCLQALYNRRTTKKCRINANSVTSIAAN